jgi:hypothetical protein
MPADGLILKIDGFDLIGQVIDALQLDFYHLSFQHNSFFLGNEPVVKGCLNFLLKKCFRLLNFLSFEISIGLFGDKFPE